MSNKRSINLLSSPISSKFQAQYSPSSSTPTRRDKENNITQQVIQILIMIRRTVCFVFCIRNRQVKNFSAPLCQKHILNNFTMSLLTE